MPTILTPRRKMRRKFKIFKNNFIGVLLNNFTEKMNNTSYYKYYGYYNQENSKMNGKRKKRKPLKKTS